MRRSPRRSKTRRDALERGYRSGFEARVAEALERKGIDALYESITLPYTIVHSYLPDFATRKFLIEAKGRFTGADRKKHLAIKKQHPELEVRFVFQLDNKLSTKSNTRYSDWCEKHGFEYCIGWENIPDEWARECKPKVRASAKRRQSPA